MIISRRAFVAGASAALAGLSCKAGRRLEGGFVNDDAAAGHALRDRRAAAPVRRTERVSVAIVGGGVAGLSAAWRLTKRGVRDVVVLELADRAGGNARSGRNEVSAYPWAAHYLPVPGPDAVYVHELLEELGVERDGVFDERALCFGPQERLYLHGRWQEGLVPAIAATARDREEFARFDDVMKELRASGEFTIPTAIGEARARHQSLDGLSFADWLTRERFQSPYLRWHADYACRDDYGAHAADTSAWAGVHYFTSRDTDTRGPLTWPDGNGWIVGKLLEKLSPYVRVNAGVSRIEPGARGVRVRAGDTEFQCDHVVFAAPTFLARHILDEAPRIATQYSPWVTANLTLDRFPLGWQPGQAWDNVVYGSPALGYVVATHQSLASAIDRTVWTFYWALCDGPPAGERARLLNGDWRFWSDAILDDLARVHPDIRDCVARLDIMRLGHAMARPAPGTIFSDDRRRLADGNGPSGRVHYANSDLSGLSLFEEAQYRGVTAAERVLAALSKA